MTGTPKILQLKSKHLVFSVRVFSIMLEDTWTFIQYRVLEAIPPNYDTDSSDSAVIDKWSGASIGAWNAAVVLSNAIRSKNWEHSAKELAVVQQLRPKILERSGISLPYFSRISGSHISSVVAVYA
jgi:hypothetical protein